MSDAALSTAEKAVPPFLLTQDPNALVDKLLPTLQAPWLPECEAALTSTPEGNYSGTTIMSGAKLPLLEAPQVTQCPGCKRVVLKDILETHMRTCATLPVTELLEADAALEVPAGRSQTKSPVRDLGAGRSSASGRAPSVASNHARSPVEHGGSTVRAGFHSCVRALASAGQSAVECPLCGSACRITR